ncbi:extracellular solute-binding protein [Breoghania sp.]|uniref:extracellular solute-binding protein n=1 Tax=Breoghania sp. TaxID=2065378 RepID=UPI002AA89A57|nr:extracellular solute-binding protein [Breoghania sp.]
MSGGVNRRDVLAWGAGATLSPLLRLPKAFAQTATGAAADTDTGPRHGLSVFGDLKYGPDFSHFDYLDPDAPKGGRMVFNAPSWAYNQNPLTFDTLNTFILKGNAPPRMELCFDTLMVRALDEPDAMYGLVAESVAISEDRNVYTFRLRPEARFHDGSPLTADDVAFSLMLLKEKGHPAITQTIRDMESAAAVDAHTLQVRFSGTHSRQLPLIVAGLPILSKAFYTVNDFTKSTLAPPLGSGPYRVGEVDAGRSIEYERVSDWWAKDLPVARGAFNFDTLRLEFFRERDIAFEAFKKGKITFREEFTSKTWATGYDFPAIRQGRVIRATFPDNRLAGTQGWFFNTRRKKFSDPRTRQAVGLAFDFEWTNENLFYGLYERTQSYFQNSDMMATGKPSPDELRLLELFRGQVPDEVFEEVWVSPKTDGSGRDRAALRQAHDLLKEAGWIRDGKRLVSADGEPLTIEFLANGPIFGRVIQPYANRLALLGIDAQFRQVDSSQFQARLNTFDFDVTARRYAMASTPGEGIRQFWGSRAAKTEGSANLAGIASPAIDALIEKVIHAESREAMTTVARALDRVLRAGHYWVPNWFKSTHTVAYWDQFGYAEPIPAYDFPVETTWWYDPEKAKRIGRSD